MRDLARDLLGTADCAVVTTLGADGRPRTRAMLNLRNTSLYPALVGVSGPNGFCAFFTTNTSSGKMADLRANPTVSVYYCRATEWRGLMLGGEMEIVGDPVLKRRIWQTGWSMYYPLGPTDPDYTLLHLQPSEIRYYHQMRSVVLPPDAP